MTTNSESNSDTSNYVKIFDTTLRDGEQAPGNSMNLQEKVRMARQLERLGVDVIEAGFPIASPDDFESVKEIAKICKNAEVCGLARSLEGDIRAAWDAVSYAKKPRIHTFVATSEVHMKYKLMKTESEVIEMARRAVSFAKSLCDRVDFSPEDAVRSQRDFLFKVIQVAIESGADTINIPDTVGYSTPEEYGDLIKSIIQNVPGAKNVIIATHCHNDLGMATANSLAGVLNGARQIECTINGIGERAGNAALEEVVMTLQTRKNFFNLNHGVNTKELMKSSQMLTSITGVPVQPNKAIVGMNAFAHESGIHQHGMLKNRETYEIMTPEAVGLDKNKLVLGKHSGRAALQDRLECLGYQVEQEELDIIFADFKNLADKKKQVFDEDLMLMIGANKGKAHESWQIKEINVVAGNKNAPSAEVVMEDLCGKIHNSKANGDGPVDAVYQAINSIIQIECNLTEYSINAITEGIDAQAVVAVKIEIKGRSFSGRSGDTDIIMASAKAYVDALNRAIMFSEIQNSVNL